MITKEMRYFCTLKEFTISQKQIGVHVSLSSKISNHTAKLSRSNADLKIHLIQSFSSSESWSCKFTPPGLTPQVNEIL